MYLKVMLRDYRKCTKSWLNFLGNPILTEQVKKRNCLVYGNTYKQMMRWLNGKPW